MFWLIYKKIKFSLGTNLTPASADFFSKLYKFVKKLFQEHYQSVKQFGHFVGPDLGPNRLQRLSADDKRPC